MEMKQESGNPVGKLLNNKNKRYIFNPAGIYLVKVNNRNTKARYDVSGAVLVSLLLTLNIFHNLFHFRPLLPFFIPSEKNRAIENEYRPEIN